MLISKFFGTVFLTFLFLNICFFFCQDLYTWQFRDRIPYWLGFASGHFVFSSYGANINRILSANMGGKWNFGVFRNVSVHKEEYVVFGFRYVNFVIVLYKNWWHHTFLFVFIMSAFYKTVVVNTAAYYHIIFLLFRRKLKTAFCYLIALKCNIL